MKKTAKILVVVFAIVAVAAAARWYRREKTIAEGYACNNNLRLLDAAKEQAAERLHLKAGATVPEAEVVRFCMDGVLPACPGGGTYSLNPLGELPTCSLGPVSVAPCHQLPHP